MAIHVEYATVAKCSPEHAWEKFQALDQWPWWNQAITKSNWIEGKPWEKGSRFYLETARPKVFKIRPVITESAPPNRIVWVGRAIGFRGEHGFSFDPQPDGTTILKTWEDFSGPASLLFGGGTRMALAEMYKVWIESLKFEAERLARQQYAHG